MASGRSLKIMLAIGLTAALLSGCHRKGSHDDDAPSGNMVITANPPKPEPAPRAVEGNTAPNMTPPKPMSSDGAFGPDYATPPSSAPGAAKSDADTTPDKTPAPEKPVNSQTEH